MKASRIIYMAAALLLTACSSEQTEGSADGRMPVTLGCTVASPATTRAANTLNGTTIEAGGQVKVRISPTGENNYTDYTYTTATGGVMNQPAENPPYYPMTGGIDIRAYYPATAATDDAVGTFAVQGTQTTDTSTAPATNSGYVASDLMWAETDDADAALDNLTKTTDKKTLKFHHKMAKITVNATPDGVKVTSITGVTLNGVKLKVTFDPSDGTTALAASDNDPATVTMTNQGSAIIPAQPISGTFITITTNAGDAYYEVSTTLEQGHHYTFNLNVNGAAIGLTNTIEDWTSEGTVNVHPTVTETRYVATPVGAIPGLFTINADGDQVFFSKGNLQYDGTNWKFADNQWDVLGADGTKADGTATGHPMDLFTWGNTSSSTEWDGDSYYTANADLSGTYDWGSNAISNGGNTANSGWHTLSKDEWVYLFGTDSSNKRTTTSGLYFAKATVNGVFGVILLPDDWSASNYSLNSTNSTDAAFTTNTISESDWSSNFEAHGCVFLPAAGYRNGTSVGLVGSEGGYWSSTANDSNAYFEHFYSGGVVPASNYGRSLGFSVRLVRRAWYKEVSSATSSDIGKIICSNGHIHTNVSDVTCGGSASAIIAYVGSATGESGYNHGLALALFDANGGSTCQWKTEDTTANHSYTTTSSSFSSESGLQYNSTHNSATYPAFQKAIANNGTSAPSGCSAWFLASGYQWNLMKGSSGMSSYTALRDCFSSVGGSNMQSYRYWSCTEYNTNYAWYLAFDNGSWGNGSKTSGIYVRSALAF